MRVVFLEIVVPTVGGFPQTEEMNTYLGREDGSRYFFKDWHVSFSFRIRRGRQGSVPRTSPLAFASRIGLFLLALVKRVPRPRAGFRFGCF